MSYFVVKNCEIRACQYWRIGNKCIKDGAQIAESIKYSTDLHNSEMCQIRKQIDVYRLPHMLEGDRK